MLYQGFTSITSPHIKAYWPMIGKESSQLALSFGADDLDGTIDDTTRIYSMAGSIEDKPAMSSEEICKLISEAGYIRLKGIHFIILYYRLIPPEGRLKRI